MVVTGVLLILFLLAGMFFQIREGRQTTVAAITTVAQLVADTSALSLEYHDYETARDTLALLEENEHIHASHLFSLDGKPLASYAKHPGSPPPSLLKEKTFAVNHYFFRQGGEQMLKLIYPVSFENKRLATLVMVSHHPELRIAMWRFLLLGFVESLMILLVVLWVISKLRDRVHGSIVTLTSSMTDMVTKGDFDTQLEGEILTQDKPLLEGLNMLLTALRERDTKIFILEGYLEQRIQERTEKLEAMKDQAVAAAEAKGVFLAHMSHEIRTPLNGVIGVLALLKGAVMGKEYQRLLETATRAADSLLLIVNDVLDFSKIEAGKIEFEIIPYDLREVVEETVALFEDTANTKNIELLCYISTDIQSHVEGDPIRLRQIITNLVGNAVKFTNQGEVVFRVGILGEKNGTLMFHFSVEDTGIGISTAAQETLFDKFTQAKGSTTRKYGGTGLGLNVCKRLVELQKGEIGLKSEEGKGTLFWFTLPMKIKETHLPVLPCERLDQKKILIVDDNATSREILKKYLKVCKTEVYTCDRADKAMVLLKDLGRKGSFPDILLVDYHLPKKNGLQLAEEIKIIFGDSAPKIHLLSSERGLADQTVTIGIQNIIQKPVRQSQLYDALLRKKQPRKSIEEKQEEQNVPRNMHGKVLLVDDEAVNQKVGGMILEKLGLEVEVAKSGREAIKMVQENEYDLILMDISMPEMNGFEATEEIRRLEAKEGEPKTPIIALTAFALQEIKERCMKVGMNEFITKPVKPEQLVEKLQPWLEIELPSSPGEVVKDSVLPAFLDIGEEAEKQSWKVEKALEFVGGDEELLGEMIELFLQKRDIFMEDIEEAMKKRNAAALCDAAHAYKGAVNHFSATKTSTLAKIIEDKGRRGDLTDVESLIIQLKKETKPLVASLQRVMTQYYKGGLNRFTGHG